MAKGNVTSERRIYIEFPTQKDHAHHLIGEVRSPIHWYFFGTPNQQYDQTLFFHV